MIDGIFSSRGFKEYNTEWLPSNWQSNSREYGTRGKRASMVELTVRLYVELMKHYETLHKGRKEGMIFLEAVTYFVKARITEYGGSEKYVFPEEFIVSIPKNN